jgi:hypothetical protein
MRRDVTQNSTDHVAKGNPLRINWNNKSAAAAFTSNTFAFDVKRSVSYVVVSRNAQRA